ncbi:MAG TPA: protein kinase [Polyangia bacterium]|nr:protein kinase [Polyangia bacterium]
MASPSLAPGMVVGGQFEIEQQAGVGGMSVVFRARDLHSGQPVALKLLSTSAPGSHDIERMLREARILSELRHPGVVAYVAHGRLAPDQIYLVMEWLEGEDLEAHLRTRQHPQLGLAETVTLARAVAEVLATVHQRGIVHRDIKPSNLFLRGGEVERVTLLDFGIARAGLGPAQVTRSGDVIGTLSYLPPEQARGERNVRASADIYAFGCVLFECLTGVPLFEGESAAAVLAQILSDEPPRLRQVRPDLPEVLEALLVRMLARDPEQRLPDGRALQEALAALPLFVTADAAPRVAPTQGLATAEQRLVSVILALPREPEPAAARQVEPFLAELLGPYGAQVAPGAEGALVVTLGVVPLGGMPLGQEGDAATDQAIRAGRCACLLREHLPEARIALVTGKALVSEEERTVATVVERAMRLLRAGGAPVEGGLAEPVIWVDELTAGLLDSRFVVRQAGPAGFVIVGERGQLDETRLLLGRPTPCVGRDQELHILNMSFDLCKDEGRAQAVLVVSPPGMGKSRLRHELLRRLRARGEAVEVLLGRGDPIQGRAACALLGQMLRQWCGVEEVRTPEARRERLAARVGRHVPEELRSRVTVFIGELCGVPFPNEQSPWIQAARREPRMMSDRQAEALVALLRAECSHQPVLLVLEDLHWSDASTMRFIDVALRELTDCPLMVLALARPEIKEQFPQLWEGRSVQELRLPALSRKASERLVREVLGANVSTETLAQITAQAAGNALFLEELIRTVAAPGTGREPGATPGAMTGPEGGALPETVLAILQARFLRMAPGARRLLRAASLLGDTFWRGGLIALLGEERKTKEVDRWLDILVQEEMVTRHLESRFPGEVEYSFRHALVREAIYGLLTAEDRQVGHRMVAEFLERMGEQAPMLLAEHYRRGHVLGRAASYYAQAAGQALDSHDYAEALHRVELGLECGPSGELLGFLRGTQAWGYVWSRDFERACAAALDGLSLLPPGGMHWYRVASALFAVASLLGRPELIYERLEQFEQVEPHAGSERAFITLAMMAIFTLSLRGLRDSAGRFLRQMEEMRRRLGDAEARTRGFVQVGTVWYHLVLGGEPWRYWNAAWEGVVEFTIAGDLPYVGMMQGHLGLGYALLGDHERSRMVLREAQGLLARFKEDLLLVTLQVQFALALVETGQAACLDEAGALARDAIAKSPQGNFWRSFAHHALASALAAAGALDEAEEEAQRALALLSPWPAGRMPVHALLCRIQLQQGRIEEAHAHGEAGLALLGELGGMGWMDGKLRLAASEAREAAGDHEGACRVLAVACRELERRAGAISDVPMRERFLRQIPEHARLWQLAAAWGVVAGA